MAELSRIHDQTTDDRLTTDQPATRNFTDTTLDPPNSRGMADWMQADRLATADTVGPRLIRDDSSTIQETGSVTPLLPESEIGELRSRWSNIQAEFVDAPRRSVQEADKLVATAVQRLAEGFANERASLEKQWDSGDSVSTEDLRVALQRYRAFFGRLLNAA
jgi:hypothetical protein